MKKGSILGLSEEGFHRIRYIEWGMPGNPNIPILCIHGLTRNGRDFDQLADFLVRHNHHVFCPDIVGRGESDWLKNPIHYTYEQYIADMNLVIARSGADQIDWVGTSMGGIIGMFFASQAHTPVRRLVLNDIGPQIPVKSVARLAKYAGKEPEFKSFAEAERYFRTIYTDFGPLTDNQWKHITEISIREVAPGVFQTKLDRGINVTPSKSKFLWKALTHPLKALEGILLDIDLWDIWRNIKCPVLVIHGKNSDILTSAIIEKMQATHDNVEVLSIENVGHAPALRDQVQIETIYRWLNKTF